MSPAQSPESPLSVDEDLTRLQERLEQSAVVTSRLCHDFGNYLTGIMGFTELGLTQAEPDSIQQRFLNEVLTSAKQGADWIRRLHLFCRRGGTQVWPSLLSSVVSEAEKAWRETGDSLPHWVADIPADLPLLGMDAISLQTALTELADNSREATNNQGRISVSARVVALAEPDCRTMLGSTLPGAHVEISIADNGPGFAPNVRPRLFRDVFYSTKPRHRGLGLLVVYGTMHRFHGGLKLDTPTGTPGACVRLWVRAADVQGPALAANANPPRILLVHANGILFESMRKILEARGCSVEMAAALDANTRASRTFTLIVIETALPQLSGFDLARRILEHDPQANFLFIHTRGSFHGLAEEELLKRFALLRWPLEPQTFFQAVQTALARTTASSS